MMIFNYNSKKDLKNQIGQKLNYTETSLFGLEFKENGRFVGSNRPQITGNGGREFFANVTMKQGLIHSVK